MGIPAPIGVSAAGIPNLGSQANAEVRGRFTGVGVSQPFAFWGPMNVAMWCATVHTLTTTKGSLAATLDSATGVNVGTAIKSTLVPKGTIVGALNGTNVTWLLPSLTYPVSGFNTVGNMQVTLPPGSNVNALLGATITASSPTAERLTIPANTGVTNIIQADVAPSLNSQGVPGIIQLSALPTLVPPEANPLMCDFAIGANAITASGADVAARFTDAATKWDATVQLESSFDDGDTFICCTIGGAGQLAQYLDQSSVRLVFGEPERMVFYRLTCIEYTSGIIDYRMSATGQAPTSVSVPAIS